MCASDDKILAMKSSSIEDALSLTFEDESPEEVARIPPSRDRIEIDWPTVERIAKRVQNTLPDSPLEMGEMLALAFWLVREQTIKNEMETHNE